MKKTILYDGKVINPFTPMGDEIVDGELYPDLPRWSGEIRTMAGKDILYLASHYQTGAPDWNAIYFASHQENDYLFPIVTMEAEVYVPGISFEDGVIIEMNPEIFFNQDSPQGNTNIFALFKLVITPQGIGLRYVGEGDQVYTAVEDITNFEPDTWNKISLTVDFKTQSYISMSVNDVVYGSELFSHKFTVRQGNGAGSNRSLIGFWIGNKSYQNQSGTPFYVRKLTVTTNGDSENKMNYFWIIAIVIIIIILYLIFRR